MNHKLKKFLRSRGFATEACESADLAQKFLERFRCDLVLVDAGLEGALELCYGVERVSPQPKLLLLVPARMEKGSVALFPGDARVSKPFTGRQLLQYISRLTGAVVPPTREIRKPSRDAGSGERAEKPNVEAPPVLQPPGRASKAPQIRARRPVQGAAEGPQRVRPRRASPVALSPQEVQRSSGHQGPANLGAPVAEPKHRQSSSPGVRSGSMPVLNIPGRGGSFRGAERGAVDNALSSTRVRAHRRPSAVRTIMHSMGRLEKTPFPALLYKMFANQSTGTLTIQAAGSERSVFFLKGEPVYAAGQSAAESLGAILVNMGYLGLEELNDVLEERLEGQALGKVLLERDLIDGEQLLEAMDRQVYERVLKCTSLSSGAYVFVDGDDWLGEVQRFPQNPIQLIAHGVERYVGPNVLASHLQSQLGFYVVRTEKFEFFEPHFPGLEERKAWLDLMDGSSTLQELTASGVGDLMSFLRFVWSLKLADMVDFQKEPRTTAERSSAKPPLPRRLPTSSGLKVNKSRPPKRRSSTIEGETPEERERRKLSALILDYYMRLGAQDHWQLLGVARDATREEVRQRFLATLNLMPPEKFSKLAPSVQEKGEEVLEALKRAYNIISEPDSRARYIDRVQMRDHVEKMRQRREQQLEAQRQVRARERAEGGGPGSEVEEEIDVWANEKPSREMRAMEPMAPTGGNPTTQDHEIEASQGLALVSVRRARDAVREGRWKDAYRSIKSAANQDPYNPEIAVFQAWVVYNLPHDDRARQYQVCRQRIETELVMNKSMPEAYYFLGYMAEEHRALLEAVEHYRTALALNPQHAEAQSRLKRLENHPQLRAQIERMQREADDGSLVNRLKGLFRS